MDYKEMESALEDTCRNPIDFAYMDEAERTVVSSAKSKLFFSARSLLSFDLFVNVKSPFRPQA